MSQPDSPVDATSRARWAAYAVILAITCGMLTAAVCRVKPLLSANDRSRWCTVWSLVHRGTFQIDEIDATPGWGTIDKVRHQGHFYSTQAARVVDHRGRRLLARAGCDPLEPRRPDGRSGPHDSSCIVNVLPMLVGVVVMAALVERYVANRFCPHLHRGHVCPGDVFDVLLGDTQ